jgi:hypothetical protein
MTFVAAECRVKVGQDGEDGLAAGCPCQDPVNTSVGSACEQGRPIVALPSFGAIQPASS